MLVILVMRSKESRGRRHRRLKERLRPCDRRWERLLPSSRVDKGDEDERVCTGKSRGSSSTKIFGSWEVGLGYW